MTDVDPLIRRELQWMALDVLENKNLVVQIQQRVRRRRIRKFAIVAAGVVIAGLVATVVFLLIPHSASSTNGASDAANTSAVGSRNNNALQPAQIQGLISDYPLTWEASIGDLGAISKPAGVGDTLGGLTALGLKVSWERCPSGTCPMTWILKLQNNTQDIVSAAPALMIYVDHGPLDSTSRPVTVMPGATSIVVYSFPEFKEGLTVSANASWQWNWFLTVAR
ncbi:MAG: hypothetical protein WCO08_08835 [Actinomycetes bacterium]